MASDDDDLLLEDQLCFALYAATAAVTRAYRPLLAEIGLTYPQYLVMVVLWRGDGCSIGALAAALDQPAHGIGPLVGRLEELGLVERRPGVDRREVRVHVSTAGRALRDSAAAAQRQVVCATTLAPAELAQLRTELQGLVAAMAAASTGARRPRPATRGERAGRHPHPGLARAHPTPPRDRPQPHPTTKEPS